MQRTQPCNAAECTDLIGSHGGRGFCPPHYKRFIRWGDPLGGSPVGTKRPKMAVEDRFWSKVSATGVCWEWQGYGLSLGYGQFWMNGLDLPAHRVAWEFLVGPIPDGLVLDHLCRNPACVNPDHLEPVTQQVNILRGYGPSAVNAKRTHASRCGHEFTPENTLITDGGRRRCRTCRYAESRRRAA